MLGTTIVGLVEVDGVDLLELDEVLDVDRAREGGLQRGELLGLDHDVAFGGDFIALDDLRVGDLLFVDGADALM